MWSSGWKVLIDIFVSLFQASIADWTTNRWVSIFSDQGEKMLGHSSAEVGQAAENNKDELEAMVSKSLFKSYIFKLRTKMENYGVSESQFIYAPKCDELTPFFYF